MDMEQEKSTKNQVNRLGERELFNRLGQRDHLGIGGGRFGDGVSCRRIDVHCVNSSRSTNDIAKSD
jgi:hypothetical protein